MTDYIRTPITAGEFFQLPETNIPTELLDGEIIVSPSPTPTHQDSVFGTATEVKRVANGGRVFSAPLDVYLDELNTPQPDVMWVAPDSKCVIGETHLVGAPDLIVEVLSPGTARHDRVYKFSLYERHEVREYWMIDPAQKLVEVWWLRDRKFARLGIFGTGDTFVSTVLGETPVNVSALLP